MWWDASEGHYCKYDICVLLRRELKHTKKWRRFNDFYVICRNSRVSNINKIYFALWECAIHCLGLKKGFVEDVMVALPSAMNTLICIPLCKIKMNRSAIVAHSSHKPRPHLIFIADMLQTCQVITRQQNQSRISTDFQKLRGKRAHRHGS